MANDEGLVSRKITRSTASVTFIVAMAACSNQSTSAPQVPDATGPQSLALYLAGAAARQLQPDGTLRIANTPQSGSRPQIDQARARELAAGFVATHLRGILPALERDRGISIDVADIAVCSRALYAESPFEELPSEVPAFYHRVYGPWWLTTLCVPNGEAVIALAVSAYATDLRIEDGKLRYPPIQGEEFRVLGIPPGEDNQLPLSPEVAVRRAASLANRRIASIPRLILQSPISGYPQIAQWQLSLDSEADLQVSPTAEKVKVKEVFLGGQTSRSKLKVKRASKDQPEAIEVRWRPDPVIGQTRDASLPAERTTRLARRAGIPLTFEDVERAGGY